MTLRRYDLACTVDPYRDGWTLHDFLVHRFRYHPEPLWSTRLAEGAVLVNGETADGARVVHAGDRIDYHVWHEEPPVDFSYAVLHEDDAVLAVAKSGNLPVHAGGKYIRHTLIAELRERWGSELRLSHRLDRETSGVVVLAKTRAAARALEREFHGRRVAKTYLALLRGAVPAEVTVDAPIGREDPSGVSSFRCVDPEHGKPARTRFVPVASGPGPAAPAATPRPATLVLVMPESGRTNQIRVHAAHLGRPVVGDKIYGVPRALTERFVTAGETAEILAAAGAPRHLLHCLRLALRHPDGRLLELTAPPPPDFADSWGGPLPDFGVSLPRIGLQTPREPPPGPPRPEELAVKTLERIDPRTLIEEMRAQHAHWEKIKDLIDSMIDMMLNYRQSGHPGGSRSKVHLLVTTLLGGIMRWDIRHPEKPFGDRFILVAGHTVPLVYATLTVFCHALRLKYAKTGDPKYLIPDPEHRSMMWEDLLRLRRNKGLAGHAEMEGKTLFFKFNTGPSGHGSPAAAGEAMALKRAGAADVRVFAFEGEGGLTTGASHETRNTAWGLGLSNLVYVVDWNDEGIDPRRCSSVVYGGPQDWFGAAGWKVVGAQNGSDWEDVSRALAEGVHGANPLATPVCVWGRTLKGRGYAVTGYKSHGTPLPTNSEGYWKGRQEFTDKHGIAFEGQGQPAPADPAALKAQVAENLQRALSLFEKDPALLDYLADRLVELGESVPERAEGAAFDTERTPFKDPAFWDFRAYPESMWAKPGDKKPNRAGLSEWAAYVNSLGRKKYGRPLFLAMAADLADSTNISGFAKGFGDMEGWGWYERATNPDGALLPQQITEFANSGVTVGLACVNLHPRPYEEFNGFYGACSTYGSFSYLKYGPMRLFSQVAQDSEIRVGKVLWIAGHSGPETAEDSRTHFGIFAPGVTDLFPEGHVCNVHPWEHNEVPVVLGAAFASDFPIVALHLTRPAVTIPDRAALGMASHFDAAKGAYLIRDFDPARPPAGTVLVQGTMSTVNLVKTLPEIAKAGLNVRIVAAISPQLFAKQPREYRDRILPASAQLDCMMVSNRSRRLMWDWLRNPATDEYALTSDWDDRWRTGGSVDEVMAEARLSPADILAGIERFVRERPARIARARAALDALGG